MKVWENAKPETPEWFTPQYVFDDLGVIFDMDVAHPKDHTHTHVPARSFLYERALEVEWDGFVWMNPPFTGAGSIDPWLDRFFAHGNGIALTADRSSAKWFHAAWRRADLIMFMPRVRFIKPDGSTGNAPANGTCLWAVGSQAVEALSRAANRGLGILASPVRLAA